MMDISGQTATVADDPRSTVRVLAVLGVVMWWLVMFGLVDLSTPFDRPVSPMFFPWYLLETGWGLLYVVLLGLPTLVLLWRPTSFDLAVQLVLVAVALVVVAAVTPAPAQAVPAVGAAGLGVAVPALTVKTLRPPAGYVRRPTRGGWVTAALVAAAAIPLVSYAADMISAARAGLTAGSNTWGIDHGPTQAAAALATLMVAAQSVLAPASRVPAWSVASCAVWFGALSVAYPEHLGSAGALGGRLAVVWGVLFALSWELAAWRRRHYRQPRSPRDARPAPA